MVIIADHSRDLPCAIFVLPEVNELRLAGWLPLFRLWVVEAMNTYLNRTIAMHGIHLKGPRNDLSAHFATDVLLYAFGQVLPAEGHSTLIVIELHIVYEERAELLQITPVIGIEECSVQRRNSTKKFVCRTLRRLGVHLDNWHCEQRQEQQYFS